MGLLHQFITFRLLFAIGEQAYTWRWHRKYTLQVDGTHQGKLLQIFGFTVSVGPHIDYQANACCSGEDASQGGSIYSFDAFEDKERCGHHGSAITCGNRAERSAIADLLERQGH